MAQSDSWRKLAARVQRHYRNSTGIEREIRDGQGERNDSNGPDSLFRRLLSGELRLHSADPRGGWRPPRCAGALPGTGRAAHRDSCPHNRSDDHDRFGAQGPQDCRRGDPGSRIQRIPYDRTSSAAPPLDAAAVFSGLQKARGEDCRSGRHSAGPGRVSGDRSGAAAVQQGSARHREVLSLTGGTRLRRVGSVPFPSEPGEPIWSAGRRSYYLRPPERSVQRERAAKFNVEKIRPQDLAGAAGPRRKLARKADSRSNNATILLSSISETICLDR